MKLVRLLFLYYLGIRVLFLLIVLIHGWMVESTSTVIREVLFSAFVGVVVYLILRLNKLKEIPIFIRFLEASRRIGRSSSTVAWIGHLGSASICIAICLFDLAAFYLPAIAGKSVPGVYTGEWREYKGWNGKTWRCIFEFETPEGTHKGTLASMPDIGEENKREICLANAPEQIVYYPDNPSFYYPKGRSQPILWNYPATGLAIALLCTGLVYVFRLLFVEGYDENGNDCNYALLWGFMCLIFSALL